MRRADRREGERDEISLAASMNESSPLKRTRVLLDCRHTHTEAVTHYRQNVMQT